jgi:hypothetical protein
MAGFDNGCTQNGLQHGKTQAVDERARDHNIVIVYGRKHFQQDFERRPQHRPISAEQWQIDAGGIDIEIFAHILAKLRTAFLILSISGHEHEDFYSARFSSFS